MFAVRIEQGVLPTAFPSERVVPGIDEFVKGAP